MLIENEMPTEEKQPETPKQVTIEPIDMYGESENALAYYRHRVLVLAANFRTVSTRNVELEQANAQLHTTIMEQRETIDEIRKTFYSPPNATPKEVE